MPNLKTSDVSDGGIVVCTAPQGSIQWFKDRAGAITGSMFPELMNVAGGLTDQQQAYVDAILAGTPEPDARAAAGYKSKPRTDKIQQALDGERVGDWTEAAKAYAFRLAVERISGEPLTDENFQTYAMRRGHELEPEAREAHAFAYGVSVEPCGFIKTDDGKFGVSADGLVEPDGGAEYKCFVDPTKLRAVHLENDPGDAYWQVQGGLWLTGRQWWHFGLYCPALAACGKSLKVIEYGRDDDAIQRLESTLVEFDRLVEDYKTRLIEDETNG